MSVERIQHQESKEKEPGRVVGRCYFFRHDKPIYSEELAELMGEYGYESSKYSSAKFESQNIPTELNPTFHPSSAQLEKFSSRGRSIPFEEKKGDEDRVRFEGTIQSPDERRNLSHLADILKQENVVPLIFVGSRTRHGLTAEAVVEALADKGVQIDKKNITVTDMLTAMNKHWVHIFEASQELGLENPWQPIVAPEPKDIEKLKEKNIESMDEIADRTRHYLAVLDRMFNIKVAKDPSLKEKSPAVVNFTSDFNQIALLQALGLNEVQGKPVLDFRPAVGSYVEVEVFADDTAKVYYQPAIASAREELGIVTNFHEKLKSR